MSPWEASGLATDRADHYFHALAFLTTGLNTSPTSLQVIKKNRLRRLSMYLQVKNIEITWWWFVWARAAKVYMVGC